MRYVSRVRYRSLCSLIALSLFAGTVAAADAPPPVAKPVTWYPTYAQACAEARKTDKLILAYFCGSDWDEWTKKLDKQVLKTDMFRDWAEKNVVLLKFDLLKFSGSSSARETIEKYKIKYNITKVPTLLFLDSDGFLIDRCGYEKASLREEEDKGKPVTWIKYCDEVIKNRPPRATILEHKTFDDAVKYSKKHFTPVVMMIGNSDLPMFMQLKADLLKNQPFVAFVNQNFAFCQIKWPMETDVSPEAVKFRQFATDNKISPGPKLQLVIYDFFVQAPKSNILARIPVTTAYIQDVDPLIEKLDQNVANPDYSGTWLEDWKQATFISNRLKRPLMVYFTQDTSEYCKNFDKEVFLTDEFKKFAKKSVVLMKVDFPKDPANVAKQAADVKEQNKSLADQYAIRGYPRVIVINFLGQRIAESGYMKGGVEPFVAQIEGVLKDDRNSRPLPAPK